MCTIPYAPYSMQHTPAVLPVARALVVAFLSPCSPGVVLTRVYNMSIHRVYTRVYTWVYPSILLVYTQVYNRLNRSLNGFARPLVASPRLLMGPLNSHWIDTTQRLMLQGILRSPVESTVVHLKQHFPNSFTYRALEADEDYQ